MTALALSRSAAERQLRDADRAELIPLLGLLGEGVGASELARKMSCNVSQKLPDGSTLTGWTLCHKLGPVHEVTPDDTLYQHRRERGSFLIHKADGQWIKVTQSGKPIGGNHQAKYVGNYDEVRMLALTRKTAGSMLAELLRVLSTG